MGRSSSEANKEKSRAGIGRPGTATALRFEIIKALCLNHVTKEFAISIERAITEQVTKCYGGTAVYIKKGACLRVRNAKILSEVDSGANVNECAARYHLSAYQVRHILRKQREKKEATNDIGFGGAFMGDLVFRIAEQLRDHEIKAATEIAVKVGEHLELQFSGSSGIYIPTMLKKILLDRNAAIYKQFQGGASHQELAAIYNITTRQVYTIIKIMRENSQAAKTKRNR